MGWDVGWIGGKRRNRVGRGGERRLGVVGMWGYFGCFGDGMGWIRSVGVGSGMGW